ncbi:paired amphipathic helix protein SIN3 2-like, partial [Trifolium pratense]
MEFADDREKYIEFLTILNDYARSVTDLRGTIARMEELLKGRKHLIITFRTFLPKEPQITLDGNDDDKAGEAKIKHLERKLLDINLRTADCVLMRPSPSEPSKPSYVARIEGIEADSQ